MVGEARVKISHLLGHIAQTHSADNQSSNEPNLDGNEHKLPLTMKNYDRF